MTTLRAGRSLAIGCAITAAAVCFGMLGTAFAMHRARPQTEAAMGRYDAGRVMVRNLQRPGDFEVDNDGPAVELSMGVKVQRQTPEGWSDEASDLNLVEVCRRTTAKTVHVGHGASLHPQRWNGHTCGSQCAASCRGNIYLGPGKFRFVVSAANGTEHFDGPAFDLPEEKR